MGNTEQTKKDIKQTSQSLKKERRDELTHSKEIKKVPGNSVQLNKESLIHKLENKPKKESPPLIEKQPLPLKKEISQNKLIKKETVKPNIIETEQNKELSVSRSTLVINERKKDKKIEFTKALEIKDESKQTTLIKKEEESTQTKLIKKEEESTQTNLLKNELAKDDLIINEPTHSKKPISIEEIEDELDRAQEHLDTYFYSIKQKHIKQLLFTINEIESAYENSYKRNVNILQLLQTIINNHDKTNLMKNPINIYKYNESSTSTDLIKYFNEYNISNSIELIPIQTISEKTCGYNSLLLLKDKRLASCTNDYSVRIFTPSGNYYSDEVIIGDSINSICELDDGTIVSCSLDYSIKFEPFIIKNAHYDYIYKVISISDDKIASCSRDNTIKIWRSNRDSPIKVLEGQHAISLLYIKERNIMISGGISESLRVWDMSTYQCDKMIEGVFCCYINALCQIDSNRVIVGGMYTIYIVNIDTYVVEKKITDKQLGYVNCFLNFRDSNTILCGCGIGQFCLYDIIKEQYSITDNNQSTQINDLILIDDCHFISCSKDIKLWVYSN